MSIKVIKQKVLNDTLWEAASSSREVQREPNHLHISGLDSCLRKQGYELLGYEPSDDCWNMDYKLSAKIGNTIHADIQRALVFSKLVIPLEGHELPPDIIQVLEQPPAWTPWEHAPALEVKLHLYCNPLLEYDLDMQMLSGRIDALLRLPDGRLAVLDIKTVKPDFFKDNYYRLLQDVAKYETQTAAYMHYLELPSGEHADLGLVMVINRGNTAQRRLYQVEYDEDMVLGHLTRAQWAAERIRKQQLPDAEPERGPCKLCNFQTRCVIETGRAVAEKVQINPLEDMFG